ncbi:hypothetical protein D9758_015541 [Tetrapyrgos nigripes]|uniref:non-specific serine/threonine protein kinase n=1 Tax=Tetrapyrgos nigripes TaxID=182062 RepID=A0A8H5FEL4_9AGAR|nr:hypothetical protein D9758_015541 [Tetrapyrgos nigripes]
MPAYAGIDAGFELVHQIGGGGFASVYQAVNLAEGRVAACKVIILTDDTSDTQRKAFEKEMRIHSVLNHKHVLHFINAVVVETKHKAVYQPGIYVLMELAAGGDLFDKIAPDVGVDDEIAHLYFNQLCDGMEYIHSEGVCHRDLKPENLLLDAAGTLKVSDFGLSSVYKLKDSGKTRMLTERCGSLPYVAPELNGDQPYAAEPIDVWGIGVILFTMLAGNTPWDEPTSRSPEWNAYIAGEIFDEAPWNRFNPEALSLICSLLTPSPSKRMTLAQAKAHPWTKRASQFVRGSVEDLADKLTQGLRRRGYGRGQLQSSTGTPITIYTVVDVILPLTNAIKEELEALGVKVKVPSAGQDGSFAEDGKLRLRIGGYDKRKMIFKGWVIVDAFSWQENQGSFCIFQRDTIFPRLNANLDI